MFVIRTTDIVDFNMTKLNFMNVRSFNNLNLNPKILSAFHLNVASMSKHFDKLNTLSALLKYKFSVIGITETLLHTVHQILTIKLMGISVYIPLI